MPRALAGCLFALAVLCLAGCDSAPQAGGSAHTDSLGRQVPAWVHNDADLAVYRCGQPDAVLDTSYDDPRPPIPSRLVTYRKARLKFAYVPTDPIGNPPPYHWKMMGVIDTRTNRAIGADNLEAVLHARLPCMLSNPK